MPEASHVCVPATHRPVSVPQRRVAPVVHVQPSSLAPSQFSSRAPSQASRVGPTDPSHAE
jgi:hypothetical protein